MEALASMECVMGRKKGTADDYVLRAKIRWAVGMVRHIYDRMHLCKGDFFIYRSCLDSFLTLTASMATHMGWVDRPRICFAQLLHSTLLRQKKEKCLVMSAFERITRAPYSVHHQPLFRDDSQRGMDDNELVICTN